MHYFVNEDMGVVQDCCTKFCSKSALCILFQLIFTLCYAYSSSEMTRFFKNSSVKMLEVVHRFILPGGPNEFFY